MKVLIIRLSAIGDIVFAAPVASALRRRHPEAHIAWLTEPAGRPLLAAHPDVDEVIVWPRGEWARLWRERRWWALARAVRRFRRQLHQRGFDLAVDLQGLLKSGLWAWLSGAPERIGLGSREGSARLMTRVLPKGGEPRQISSEYRYLAEQLGWDTAGFMPQAPVDAASAERAAARLRALGLAPRRYAVICPFTTRPQKHWFDDHWRALAAALHGRGLPVLLLGGPGDRAAARRLVAGTDIVDLAGQTSLPEAAALIRDSALLVGVDTGLTHMGTAWRRPTVCLFGSTRPYLETPSPLTRVIYHDLPCAPCRRRPTCQGRFDCLRGITPDEVLAAAEPLLAGDAAS